MKTPQVAFLDGVNRALANYANPDGFIRVLDKYIKAGGTYHEAMLQLNELERMHMSHAVAVASLNRYAMLKSK